MPIKVGWGWGGGGGVVRQEKKMKVTRVFHTNKGDGKTSYEKERKKKSIF